MRETDNEVQFWTSENVAKINQSKLIQNLNNEGYANLRINPTNYLLVKCSNNKIVRTSEPEIITLINDKLKRNASEDVQEVFAKGVGNYVSPKKLNLLNTIEFSKERDDSKSSIFFYQNVFCKVTNEGIQVLDYSNLDFVIWQNKINKQNFTIPANNEIGDFEVFCKNLTFNDIDRFKSFKTMIGYLLHRNKDISEPKAVILYDEKMGFNNQAHGGTGKTLIISALQNCRELVYVSGKDLKIGSFFKNQRINITSDIIAYDDLKENVNFEDFYTMITSSIEVEKKGKQSFLIEFSDAPKILLSSNYLVKGDGGNSDLRRRYEFEIANYYSKDFTPEMEFGKRFFSSDWCDLEWDKFHFFMMSCIQDYLIHGLIEVSPINLEQTKINYKSCSEFIEFVNEFITLNEWLDKREIQNIFEEFYPNTNKVSAHLFNKWMTNYSYDYNCQYKTNSTGGKYLFILEKEEVVNA